MPGSLAKSPRHERRDRGVGGRLTEELTEELEEDHGGDTVGVATVVASKRHHPVCYGDGGAAQNPWPSGQAQHRTWGRRRGCRRHPIGGDSRDTTTGTESGAETPARSSQRRSSRRGEIDRGDARGRWRRTAARPTNRRGQMEELGETKQMPCMATAELAGARRNRAAESPAIPNRQRGVMTQHTTACVVCKSLT
jgi:hypothetical protein